MDRISITSRWVRPVNSSDYPALYRFSILLLLLLYLTFAEEGFRWSSLFCVQIKMLIAFDGQCQCRGVYLLCSPADLIQSAGPHGYKHIYRADRGRPRVKNLIYRKNSRVRNWIIDFRGRA